jgi:hypothetical protein
MRHGSARAVAMHVKVSDSTPNTILPEQRSFADAGELCTSTLNILSPEKYLFDMHQGCFVNVGRRSVRQVSMEEADCRTMKMERNEEKWRAVRAQASEYTG